MIYTGISVSPGVSIGKIYLYQPFTPSVTQAYFDKKETAAKLARYRNVKKTAIAELKKIRDDMMEKDPDKAKIFSAHLDLISDEDMEEEITAAITETRMEPDYAIDKIYAQTAEKLSRVKNALIRERAADIKDLRLRLLRCWAGISGEKSFQAQRAGHRRDI